MAHFPGVCMTLAPGLSDRLRAGVLVFADTRSSDWAAGFRTLEREAARSQGPLRVYVPGAASAEEVSNQRDVAVVTTHFSAEITKMFRDFPELGALLIVFAPLSVPDGMLARATEWMSEDARIATVSFLSNAAGPLSYPDRYFPDAHRIPGGDETTVTSLLRTLEPDAGAVPLAVPVGSAILVSRSALLAAGGLDEALDSRPREALLAFALRASRRGFQHRLDASTFVRSLWFEGFPAAEPANDDGVRQRLHQVHVSFPALYDQQNHLDTSPCSIAMNVARSKLLGLRVLIDGSCLGPMEMGTQVQTVELVRALSRRSDIQSIGLAVPHAHMPAYAQDLLRDGKVTVYDSHDLQFIGAQRVDIVHRPFQPDRPIPWGRWQALGKRVLVTLQDLIAYRIGDYHPTGNEWLAYRHNIADACAHADGVVAISDDTRVSIEEECLDIALERVHTVKNGTNHLDVSAVEETPLPLVERGLVASRFMLVLGANYAHKNRDIAIRVWQKLRENGEDIVLVMAGAAVPRGSLAEEEGRARRNGGNEDALVILPDVSSGVRTWLLRHAAVVLYPTSAEGFGLVPFEAAAMGAPTAHVNFGPLRELIGDDSLPRQWGVDELAEYASLLLTDISAARENIGRILRRGASLTWDETARGLVNAYRQSLARPPRKQVANTTHE